MHCASLAREGARRCISAQGHARLTKSVVLTGTESLLIHRWKWNGLGNFSSAMARYLAMLIPVAASRALSAVFGGAVSKDTVSRVWRKVKGDWDAWNARSFAAEPIIRLILDGTVVRVRLDRKATAIVLLVVLGVREDGQKVLLAAKNMGGETSEAWRAVLDDLVQ